MPYFNAYNARIAQQLDQANRNWAVTYAFSPVDGIDSGGNLVNIGNASKFDGENGMYNDIDLGLGDAYQGVPEDQRGGSGFAEGTFRDTGEGSQVGVEGGVGHYKKKRGGTRLGKPPSDLRKERGGTKLGLPDGAIVGVTETGGRKRGRKLKGGAELLNANHELLAMPDPVLSNGIPPKAQLKSNIGGRKRNVKEPVEGCGTKELKEDVSKFDFNRLKDWIGLAKPKECGGFKKITKLRGKGFDEFKKDVGSFDFNRVKDWIGLGKYGKGAKDQMVGGWFWDDIGNFFTKTLPSVATKTANTLAQGTKKAVDAISGKGKECGAGKSGGSRSARAAIVKKIMKERSVSMIQASKIVKSEGLYKKD